jgi:hypothetical protein
MDSSSGKILFKSDRVVNLDVPFLSPDGHYLAAICALSRPVQGDSIWYEKSRGGGALVNNLSQFTPSKYWPGVIEDWSIDGKWILWDWRTPDPNNDGAWLRDDIGITSADGRVRHKIDRGQFAHFSPDGKLIFYLRPRSVRKIARQAGPYELVLVKKDSREQTIIERGVISYLVY